MTTKTQNWVISIGVNFSQNHKRLNCSHFDAHDVFRIMSQNWECSSETKALLIDKEATTSYVNITLNEILMRLADEDDRIFIYLSGHIDVNVRSITGSFITYDYCKEKRNYGLNLRSLRYIVEDSRAKYIIVVIDGCSSGIIAQGNKNNTPHWFYFTTGEMDSQISTKFFITAVSSGRNAYEHKGKRNSEFSEVFLKTILPFIDNKNSLSTSLFYEILVKMAKKKGIEPVKSGVEVGYSTFIKSPIVSNIIDSKEIVSYLPVWAVDIFACCKKNISLLDKDKSIFIKDNNFPDGSRLKIGQVIRKSWRIRNSGNIFWKNRFLKMIGEFRGSGRIHCNKLTPIPNADPNQEIDIAIELRMPPHPCSVYAEFKMIDSSGNILFPNQRGLYVTFDVIDESDRQSSNSSATNKNNGCFLSREVYGDLFSSEVKTLSSFKDNFLVKKRLGSQLVQLYYSDYGKRMNCFIKEHFPFMIPFIRKSLNILIYFVVCIWSAKEKKRKV